MEHIPVLANEVLEGLHLHPGATVIDATLGLGGHAKLILERIGTNGHLIGFDRDAENLDRARQTLAAYQTQVTFIHDSYANMSAHDLPLADAMLFDLGFSSVHVDDPTRGFSFLREGPLDMRYDKAQELTAEQVVNSWSKKELAALFRAYGEEPRAREIAKAIFDARRKSRLTTTTQLAEVIASVVKRRGRMHPATRVFQALRMHVNQELPQLEKGLEAAVKQLKSQGRIVVISFHSLEDRIVKHFLRDEPALKVITKKPIQATHKEVKENPRARSAKLRVAEKQ